MVAMGWRVVLFVLMGMADDAGSCTGAGGWRGRRCGAGAGAASAYLVTYFETAPAAADAVAGDGETIRGRRPPRPPAMSSSSRCAKWGAAIASRFSRAGATRPRLRRTAQEAAALQNRLQPQFAAPFDTRTSSPMLVAGLTRAASRRRGGAVYVLTHVDVPGPAKDECIELLKQLTAASRNQPGLLRFDVVQQDSRPNHFTVHRDLARRGRL